MPINQSNLLTSKEWHVRTELWKDKIYHLPVNPYKFPKNDGQGDFLPLPKKFQDIITEFKEVINKQKATERTEEECKEAKERIKEIRQELKEWVETIIATYGSEPTEEEEEQIKAFNQALRFTTLNQWRRWSKNALPKEEIIR